MTDTPETKPDTITIAEIGNSRASWAKAGVAVGIGSAAIAAALLYANRPSKKRK